ncbi:glycosyltransferase [Frateuria sp. GZRe12]|uniref:glycosyltransferase n=1 Tax=Frateuria sp. GZRe12 TaxID=3351533 RepID=UPI003EDBF3E6
MTVNVLFIGKRHYTNRDALTERYGRIYQLPRHWSCLENVSVSLWLLDYHGRTAERSQDGSLQVISTPVRGLAWLGRLARYYLRASSVGRPNLVVASGDCYIGTLGRWLARRLPARFVFDVYDKYDEFGAYRRPFGKDLFGGLLRDADVRFFASRTLQSQIAPLGGSSLLVPNGVDTGRFHPLEKDASRLLFGLPLEKRLVGYFGSMEPDRGVQDLIEAVGLLRAEGLPVELLLGGNCGRTRTGQPGVRYLGNVPFEDMPRALACCDVLAVPYRRSAFMDAGASNKIAEALAAVRPVVTTRTPNFTNNFPEQAWALRDRLAEPGDPGDLARCLHLQLTTPVLATMPQDMDWKTIAIQAFSGMQPAAGETHPVSGLRAPSR